MKIILIEMEIDVGWVIFLGAIEAIIFLILWRIKWWAPVFLCVLIYAIPYLTLTYSDMPFDDKIVKMTFWLVTNTLGAIGAAFVEAITNLFRQAENRL